MFVCVYMWLEEEMFVRSKKYININAYMFGRRKSSKYNTYYIRGQMSLLWGCHDD